MMRMLLAWPLCTILLVACESKWNFEDGDGDGISAAEGDCWDKAEGPEGSSLSGSDIHPFAEETWYDGFDQNCAGDDDYDADGDGYLLAEYVGLETQGVEGSGFLPPGDCWDEATGPGDGAITGAEINESATDTWYDGVDQDCGGEDDFDADGDGYVSDENVGAKTLTVEGTGALDGGDCWDDPSADPGMEPVDESSDAYRASAVNSNVPLVDDEEACDEAYGVCEYWYDGVDSNCDGADDFDRDEDGQRSQNHDDASGAPAGVDCFDHAVDDVLPVDNGLADAIDDLDLENSDVLAFLGIGPEDIFDGADDPFYDGLNQDCGAYGLDCDADEDTFTSDGGGQPSCADDPEHELCAEVVCVLVDCDDTDATILPDDTEEVYYNGIDDNCDYRNGDGDADNDDFWADDYEDRVEASFPGTTPLEVPIGASGDCDDDNSAINPGQPEFWYDGIDANCDANDDYDQDGDGYYHRDYAAAYALTGGSLPGNDCDDDPSERGDSVNPGASEVWYDAVDQDCNGQDDFDQDDDGFHSRDHEGSYSATEYISGSGGLPGNDCDDTRTDVNDDAPDAWYSGDDEDCDGRDDYDQDEDGFHSRAHEGAYGPTTYASGTGVLPDNDCNDTNGDVNPDATETCGTSYDDDCDDDDNDEDALACNVYHADRDDDLHGLAADSKCYCEVRGDYTVTDSHVSAIGGDCDDDDDDIHPSHSDIWYDGVDSDCGGNDDYDRDGDGYVRDGDVGKETHPVSGSGALPGNDCNDVNPAVHPDRTELCSTAYDDDCDGNDNDPGASGCTTRYADVDSDGYGDPDDFLCLCAHEGIYNEFDDDDCDDSSSSTKPFAAPFDVPASACRKDADGDDYGDPSPGAGITAGTDCDDDRSDVHPGAFDAWYSGEDEDCDGRDDYDRDEDGYFNEDYASVYGPTTYAPGTGGLFGGDCDDTNSAVSPSGTETCLTPFDDDCDGNNNDDGAVGCFEMFADADGDSWGDEDDGVCFCDPEGVYLEVDTGDCDDSDSAVFPFRTETCLTPHDDNCNGETNELDAISCSVFCRDADGDGFGDEDNAQCSCEPFSGYVDDCDDCNDAVSSINPGATESCDAIDSDCDGSLVDSPTGSYPDRDGDALPDCVDRDDDGDGYDALADGGDDCDDTDEDINPGETEIWYDGVDTDCDGEDDFDADSDGYASEDFGGTDCDDTDDDINPGEAEVWYDGVDTDCDGEDDFDADSDGYASDAFGGTDCDDTDEDINPGEDDGGAIGIDENCNGFIDEDDAFALLDASPAEDVLLFTEMQVNPGHEGASMGGEKQWEWFEVYNNTDQTLYLDKWRFSICVVGTTCRRFIVAPSKALSVVSGDVLLFCYNSTRMDDTPTPAVDCDYNYGSFFSGSSDGNYNSGFQLVNSDSGTRELSVEIDGELVDSVDYHSSGWPGGSVTAGEAYSFDGALLTGSDTDLAGGNDNYSPDWCDNDNPTYEYHVNTVSSGTISDYGTPGEVNPDCDDI